AGIQVRSAFRATHAIVRDICIAAGTSLHDRFSPWSGRLRTHPHAARRSAHPPGQALFINKNGQITVWPDKDKPCLIASSLGTRGELGGRAGVPCRLRAGLWVYMMEQACAVRGGAAASVSVAGSWGRGEAEGSRFRGSVQNAKQALPRRVAGGRRPLPVAD